MGTLNCEVPAADTRLGSFHYDHQSVLVSRDKELSRSDPAGD